VLEGSRELEADGDTDQHAQSSLLGQQRLDGAQAALGIVVAGGFADDLLVGGVKPAALGDGRAQHALQRRRHSRDDVLCLGEAIGCGDLGDRRLQFLIGIGTVGHGMPDHTKMVVALTSLSHGAGCGCKLPASAIAPLLAGLPRVADDNVLVGYGTADDAGVYRLSDELAIVQTVDFFTPIVDDPRDFGRIAACNALSDVYAMGGRPITALNLVAFSVETLGAEILAEILAGGAAVAAEAGVAIVGGHSIDDAEPKYGMAVTGVVEPRRLLTNAGGQAGDVLVLTKPLGAGAVSTAVKRGLEAPLSAAVSVMTTLNRDACQAAVTAGAHGMTDVTGFGLLGHLHELCCASGVAAVVEAGAVPAIEGVVELLGRRDEKAVAGGTRRNRAHAEAQFAAFADGVAEARRWLCCDAMTSGGLLVALDADRAAEVPGAVIGRLVAGEPGQISVQ
jgi:selenide,water dikinase